MVASGATPSTLRSEAYSGMKKKKKDRGHISTSPFPGPCRGDIAQRARASVDAPYG